MIITHVDKDPTIQYSYLNLYPDQFNSEKDKQDPSWAKNTMDYFANVAFAQYMKNRRTFVKNYDLLKGIIDYSHFYREQPEVKSFVDTLIDDTELPRHIKHYPILNPPVNTLIGELTKRPNVRKVRAFDDDSKSEELSFKTDLVQQLIIQEGKKILLTEMAQKGQDTSNISDDDLNKLVLDKVQEYMTSFTTLGERWGNHVMTALHTQFNLKEKSEDAFRDMLIASREYYHIFEDNSSTGFNVEVVNPKNYWQLGTPDSKYTSQISGDQNVPYALGTVTVMEISEIIEKFPDLTTEEIDHLRTNLQDYGLINTRESNLFLPGTGQNTIKYDTYNRLILQERMIVESEMKENNDELKDWLGLSNATSAFGYKYSVVRSYWASKKKIGLLTFTDIEGNEQTTLVDEQYKEGTPGEISIKWGWINQMYQGIRIGPDIYQVKPLKILSYNPIIGVTHEIKNTSARSLVDLMLPFQVLYNICMNQLFELIEKEIGILQLISVRHVSVPKDGDAQDSLQIWEEEAREKGLIFVDDSPENLKGGQSIKEYDKLDLTRTQEIQSRYTLAAQLKTECWELVGMNRQRLGGALATETATANQNALVQSFAQTEPYFAAHEYVLNQLNQAILDAAQYVESNKKTSSISYITNQGENAFIEVAGSDLKLKDLKIFVTSSAEDQQLLNEFRQLSQAILQNGGSVYDVSVLYTTNSLRQMQQVFKSLADKQEQMKEQQQQMEQSELQQKQQESQATLQQTEQHFQQDLQMRKYEADLKANTEITKAEISTYFQAPDTDTNGDGVPDIGQIAGNSLKQMEILQKRDLENKKISLQMDSMINDNKQKAADRETEKAKMANDLKIEKLRQKNKPKTK